MRTWIGVGILVLLLGIGIFFTAYTADTQNRIAQTLFESREAAAVGQWERAAGKCYQARALWEKHQTLTATVVDHEPMEEVDALASDDCDSVLLFFGVGNHGGGPTIENLNSVRKLQQLRQRTQKELF